MKPAGLRVSIFYIFITLLAVNASAQSNYTELTDKIDLLTLHINTNDGTTPSYQHVYPPLNCDGVGITNAEKLKGDLTITRLGETLYSSGKYKKDESGITIKVRGNTSAANASEKKPYKIKLQKKADLLFRGDKKYADKNWVLLNINDMLTYTGNMINKQIGMEWTPEHQYVFVYLNGDFRGLYILSESIDRNTDCRINVSKEGYIFEYDAYWWNEDVFVPSTRIRYNYTFKYPDAEDITIDSKNYIASEIAKFEHGFFTKDSIADNISLHSFARWLMVHDIIGSQDFAGSNLYFSKKDASSESPISMICAWDFDGAFSVADNWSSVHNKWWFEPCFNLPQKDFINDYLNIYDTQVDNIFNSVIDSLNTLKNSAFANTMEQALALESARWHQTTQFPQQIDNIISYLTARKKWMPKAMEELRNRDYKEVTVPENTPSTTTKKIQYLFLHLKSGKTQALLCSNVDSICVQQATTNQPKDSLHIYLNTSKKVTYEVGLLEYLDFEYGETDSVTDDCGNSYLVRKIGTKYWMAENLKCNVYSANSEIGQLAGGERVSIQSLSSEGYDPTYSDASKFEASPYTDNLTPDMRNQFGYLYNWAAAVGVKAYAYSTKGFDSERQGICPDGFHIPTKNDWENLCDNLYGYNESGIHLRTQNGWYKGDPGSAYYEGMEDVGLNSVPTGYAYVNTINHVGEGCYYWSSDVFVEQEAYGRYLFYNTSKFGEYHYDKGLMLSVRCVR